MAGEPEAGAAPEPAEIDIEAIDDLPPEQFEQLKRGEIEPPKKGAKAPEKDTGVKDEFDVDPKSETVPHGQFHRVNERRKAAEAETAKERTARETLEKQNAVLSQRFTELIEASKPAPEARERPEPLADPGAEPDAAEQPVEWIVWRQQRDRFEAQRQGEQRAQQTETERILNAKTAEYVATKEQFPAIEEARKTVLSGWHREFWLQGFRGPQLDQRVAKMEADYTVWAHRQNMPIANVIAELAMARGWKPPDDDALANPTNGAAATGADAAATPRDATGKFVKAAAEMDRLEKTKQASKSLGGSGGPADTGELTPQMIADMSNEDFAALKEKWGDKTMAKAFGQIR